jgi:hypothetical protein
MRYTSILLAVVLLPVVGLAAPRPDKRDVDKIAWGKEANGVAVSVAPAPAGPGKLTVRWKNVGKETLELPWVRFGSHAIYKNLDDLLGHVSLKGPDGKLVPARQYRFPIIGGPPYRPRTVILAPGQTHEETIDLWTYLDKPAAAGRYQASLELDVPRGFAPSQKGARFWIGKVRSNVLELKLGK